MSEDAADPELREVAGQAHASLLRVKGHASAGDLLGAAVDEAVSSARSSLFALRSLTLMRMEITVLVMDILQQSICCGRLDTPLKVPLIFLRSTSTHGCVRSTPTTVAVAGYPLKHVGHAQGPKKQEGEELCNCEFSLAYGAGLPCSKGPW